MRDGRLRLGDAKLTTPGPSTTSKPTFQSERLRVDRDGQIGGLVGVGFNALTVVKPVVAQRDEIIINPRRLVVQRGGSAQLPPRSGGTPTAFNSLRQALAGSGSPRTYAQAAVLRRVNSEGKERLNHAITKSPSSHTDAAPRKEGADRPPSSRPESPWLSGTSSRLRPRVPSASRERGDAQRPAARPSSASSRSNAPSSRGSARARRRSSSSSSSSSHEPNAGRRAEENDDNEEDASKADEKEEGEGERDVEEEEEEDAGAVKVTRRGKAGGKTPKKFCVFLGHCNNTSLLVMRVVMERLGWKEVDREEQARFVWLDPSHAVRTDLVQRVCRRQRVNFFPGMRYMCNKAPLYRTLNRCRRGAAPEDFFFFPSTWVLPEDWAELEEELRQKKPKTFIVKPDGGAQGSGIFLVRSGPSAEGKLSASDRCIVQRYVHRPLLLGGFKFDLRLYVLVTSVDPLRCYLHRDGLARFCTTPYATPNNKNLEEAYMHLTNYSLNKHNSEAFVGGDADNASKRSISTVWEQMSAAGLPTEPLWEQLKLLCVRTLQAMLPRLWMSYHACVTNEEGPSMCFQIVGFDAIIDHRLRPWLLETNNGPSLNLDEEADRAVKEQMVAEALAMVRTVYKQPMKPAAAGSPVTEEEVATLRQRRWQAHLKAAAWERKQLDQLELLWDGEGSEAHYLLFPLLRPALAAAFELAARLGDRDRQGIRGLNPPRFAQALKHLGVLDGRRVVRADVDLLYIDTLKDQDRDKGMTFELFGTALASLAKRLYPGAGTAGEAVKLLLNDSDSPPSPRKPPPPPVAGAAHGPPGGTKK